MVSPYEHYSSGLATRFGRGFLFPLLKILLIAFLLHLFISRIFITSFQVDSGSMRPALEQKDRLLVSTLVYGGRIPFLGSFRLPALRPPARGDIVVLESPAYVRAGLSLVGPGAVGALSVPAARQRGARPHRQAHARAT